MKSMFKGIAISLAMLILFLLPFSNSKIVYAAEDIVTDLSNPEFGEVTEIVAPDSIPDIDTVFTLGFGFHIYDARSFPDGTFTYTLPDTLDYSEVANKQIQVVRDEEPIGYAVIDGSNVITFHIDPANFLDDPNGVDGNIAIICKLGDDFDSDDEEAEIRFSDSQSVKIVIDIPDEPEPTEDPGKEPLVDPEPEPVPGGEQPSFDVNLSKAVVNGENGLSRDASTGIVNWECTLTIDGEGDGYELSLTDTILPNSAGSSGYAWSNGKRIGAEVVKDSVKIVTSDGRELSDVNVTYKDNTFVANLKNLSNGEYKITYSTYDYYDTKDKHTFPAGNTVIFNNEMKTGTPGPEASAKARYEVVSEGLPMYKSAAAGRYDAELQTYVIPWSVYVNRNGFGQSISSLETGAVATVNDILPEHLIYRAGTSVIRDSSGKEMSLEPSAEGDTLTWSFEWPSAKYCKISFETYVDKDYYESALNSPSNGGISLRFTNKVNGSVGGSEGAASGTSNDPIRILEKSAQFREETQRIDYKVVVNSKALMLNDGKELTLTDEVTNGSFVTGSLKVSDHNTGEAIALDESKIIFSNQRTRLTAMVPDGRALDIEYSVAPDVKSGTDAGGGKVSVEVSNNANLLGKTNTKAGVGGKYVMNKVSANVSSRSGSVTITKTDKDNAEVKLAGADIALYRVDPDTKEVTHISTKTTSDPLGFVKFSEDGSYRSLIFDTLYYYQEVKSPDGFKIDNGKHYFIFASGRYQSIKDKVAQAAADGDLVVIDVKTQGSDYEVELKNEKVVVKPEDPKKGSDPGSSTPGNSTPGSSSSDSSTPSSNSSNNSNNSSNSSSVTARRDVITISASDLPEVLGVSRDDLPEVLGARRAATGDDSNMSLAIILITAALIVIYVAMRKDSKTKQ